MIKVTTGVPTMYNGIQFRSRLEAKWAYMFAGLEWRYTYEPFDADGYIPDFLLHLDTPAIVEIKPVVTADEYAEALRDTLLKLGDHWNHDVVVLGAAPYYISQWGVESLGSVFTRDEMKPRARVKYKEHDGFLASCWPCIDPATNKFGLYGSYDDSIYSNKVSVAHLDDGWAQASNETQWGKEQLVRRRPSPPPPSDIIAQVVQRDISSPHEGDPRGDPFGGYTEYAVTFAYNPDLVELLKLTVDHHDREWCPDSREWLITPGAIDALVTAFEQFGAIVKQI